LCEKVESKSAIIYTTRSAHECSILHCFHGPYDGFFRVEEIIGA